MEEIINMLLPEENRSISTLVFMDLEATGLPSYIGKKSVHITEISLVAIDREDFERDDTFRVLNKLNLCIRPRSVISHGAMAITGLYNDILENQEVFDETIPKLLKYFFKRLRSPVCLLAHNGKRYDFPLLQAELKRINYELGTEVLCVDTLEALRSILNQPPKVFMPQIQNEIVATNETNNLPSIQEKKEINIPIKEIKLHDDKSDKMSSNKAFQNNKSEVNIDLTASDEEIDTLLSEDIDLFNNVEFPPENTISDSIQIVLTTNKDKNENLADKDISFQNEHTPSSRTASIAEQLPAKRRKNKDYDPTYSPKKQYKLSNSPSSLHLDVRRKLFEDKMDNSASVQKVVPQSKPVQFSLPKLYEYFFGEGPPISHYAEADCIALSKVCQKVNKEFLKWIDDNSFPFNEIKEMW